MLGRAARMVGGDLQSHCTASEILLEGLPFNFSHALQLLAASFAAGRGLQFEPCVLLLQKHHPGDLNSGQINLGCRVITPGMPKAD